MSRAILLLDLGVSTKEAELFLWLLNSNLNVLADLYFKRLTENRGDI